MNLRRWGFWLVCSLALGVITAVSRAQCGPQWRPGLGPAALNGAVLAATAWDADGAGPLPMRVVVGGSFTASSPMEDHIAVWDSSGWKRMGSGMSGEVTALTTWDPDGDGPAMPVLIAGGSFLSASAQAASRIARWNGTLWLPLAGGLDNTVRAVTTWDPDGDGPLAALLIAAGDFTAAGGSAAAHIAAWDGTSWSALGAGPNAGLDGPVLALASFDPDGTGPATPLLIAAGEFASAGGSPASRIAAWDGSTWRPLGEGLSADPSHAGRALLMFDADSDGADEPQLIVGGDFISAGGLAAQNIARWSPTSGWTTFPSGFDGAVTSLVAADIDGPGPSPRQVVAGGHLITTSPAGPALNHIAIFDGAGWQPLAAGTDAAVHALAAIDPDGPGLRPHQLIAAGDFLSADGHPVLRAACWDEGAWKPFGSYIDDPFTLLFDVTAHDFDGDGPQGPQIVAGGVMDKAGGHPVGHIARWDGGEWHPIGSGLDGGIGVRALASWDRDGAGPLPARLYAGGDFLAIPPGRPSTTLAEWRDGAWHHVFPPPPFGHAFVFDLTTWDSDGPGPTLPWLILAGEFNVPVSGGSLRSVAAWDGSQIIQLGSGTGGRVIAATSWDPDGPGPQLPLLVTGLDDAPNPVRAWNGSAWTTIPVTFTQGIGSLASWDPDGSGPRPPLLAAVGGGRVRTWDGSAWTILTGVAASLWDLVVWDPDGAGPDIPGLVVSGAFSSPPSIFGVARWNGAQWLAFSSGLGPSGADGRCVTTWDPDGPGAAPDELVVAGAFQTAGGLPSAHVAVWSHDNAPFFAAHPATQSVTPGQTARFSVTPAAGLETTSTLAFEWRRDGVTLADGPTSHGSIIAGARTATLYLFNTLPEDRGDYSCIIANACGERPSHPAPLQIGSCRADLNGDGVIDFADYLEFLNLFDALDLRADLNEDGVIDFGDYLEFLNHYDAGC